VITSSVRRGEDEHDGRFAWVLEVRGCPLTARGAVGAIRVGRVHHRVYGCNLEVLFSRVDDAADQPAGPAVRPWSDDMLAGMTPGPRAVGEYQGATCSGGVLRAPSFARGTMRGVRRIYAARRIGSRMRRVSRSTSGTRFRARRSGNRVERAFRAQAVASGEGQPMHQRQFSLTGRYDVHGTDTRTVA